MKRLWLLALVPICMQAEVAVRGTVVDPSGALVPEAKLALSRSPSGDKRQLSAGPDGRFAFDRVADGDYVLGAQAAGLTMAARKVKVVGEDVEIRLEMRVAEGGESVNVASESSRVLEESVAGDRNADRLSFDDDTLRSLPAPGQDALAVVSAFLSPAAQGGEGVTVMVDGVETSASSLPASSIRRLRINRNPYALQFRRPGKARIDVYSEEASLRRYRGGFGVAVRNSTFDAKNAFAPSKPDLSRSLIDFNFSGPISRGRTSYYVNAEHYRNGEVAVVNAQTLSGPLVTNVSTPERRVRLVGRVEERGEVHQMVAQYSLLDQSEQNRGVGGLRLPEQGIPASLRGHRIQFSDRALLLGRLLNDLRVVAQREEAGRGILDNGPAVQVHGAFTGGSPQTYRQRCETAVRVQNLSSMALGRHNLRFGVEARPAIFDSVERLNFGGTYEFANLTEFANRRALLFRVNQGDPRVRFGQHEAFGFVQDEMSLAKTLTVTYGVRYGWQSGVDSHNVAPRASFAWTPGGGKTVIRGGAGVFHERVNEDVFRRALLWDGVRMRESVYQNTGYPFFPPAQGLLPPPSIVQVPRLVAPVLMQASMSVERKLWKRNVLTVEYQRIKGTHSLRSRDVNSPAAPFGARPDPRYLNVNQVESSAAMRNEALGITLRGALGKRLTGMAQYTLSRTEDDTSGAFELPANSRDLGPEWSRSGYDQRHRFNAAAMLDMPSGFRLGAFASLASGKPYDITTGRDDNGDTVVNDRPVGVSRNAGLGPGLVQFDLRFTKLFHSFRLLERNRKSTSRNVEISIDAFNLFNRTNFAGYVGVQSSPFFGRANTALTPRTVQVSLRYRL